MGKHSLISRDLHKFRSIKLPQNCQLTLPGSAGEHVESYLKGQVPLFTFTLFSRLIELTFIKIEQNHIIFAFKDKQNNKKKFKLHKSLVAQISPICLLILLYYWLLYYYALKWSLGLCGKLFVMESIYILAWSNTKCTHWDTLTGNGSGHCCLHYKTLVLEPPLSLEVFLN